MELARAEVGKERDGEGQQAEPGDDPLGPQDHAAPGPRGEGEEEGGEEGDCEFAAQRESLLRCFAVTLLRRGRVVAVSLFRWGAVTGRQGNGCYAVSL